jgi:hypothetical protein
MKTDKLVIFGMWLLLTTVTAATHGWAENDLTSVSLPDFKRRFICNGIFLGILFWFPGKKPN